MVLLWIFDVARFIPLLVVMAYASKSDLKTGYVRNRFWLYFFVGASLTLVATLLDFNVGLVVMEALSFGFAAFFGLLLYVLNGWGGADAKAFIVIGASMPLFPRWGLLYALPFPFGTLPFLVLFTSCALAVAYAVVKPSDVPMKQRKVRFLPFMFVGLVVAFIL